MFFGVESSMAFLSTSNGNGEAERYELIGPETTLGRHPDCSIVVEAGAVSRYHAKILKQADRFVVEDCGSRNGTFLNGQLLTGPEWLQQGDAIRVSDVEFVFQDDLVPEFARGGSEMTFEGTNFGIMMVDGNDTERVGGNGSGTGSGSAKVEFRSSADGFKMIATPEAKLEALMQINRNLTGALAVDEVLPKVLSSLFSIFPAADRGFVVMQ